MDSRKETAEKIIAVLTNRSGFNDLWYNLDEDIQTEITDEIVNILPIHDVSGIIAEIDSLKKFNVESVDSDGKRVIEYDKDGMFVDANELDKKILSYR